MRKPARSKGGKRTYCVRASALHQALSKGLSRANGIERARMRETLWRAPRRKASDRSAAERPSAANGDGAQIGMPLFMNASAAHDQSAYHAAISFPHASSIQSATGASIPGSAIYDPDACQSRGVPA